MSHDSTDFDLDLDHFLALDPRDRPRPKLAPEQRPKPTPRVLSVLLQQAYGYKKDRKVTLTEAKDTIASEYGFDSWQHLKNLSIAHASIGRKTVKDVEHLFEIKTEIQLRLDFEDQSEDDDSEEDTDDEESLEGERWITADELSKRVQDENPPTEAVYFNIALTLVSKADSSVREVGRLSGHMFFLNDRNSLFFAFDAQSQELADFAAAFELKFDKSVTESVLDLAYIEEIFVEEEFDESSFSRILLEACTYELGGLASAVFSQPVPMAVFPNPQGLSFLWDRSRGRTKNLVSTHEKCDFKRIKGTEYLMWNAWDWD